eukprot:1176415-Prorocentrum_minimum.AAC.3
MPWPTNTWYMKSSLAWSSQHSRAFAAGGGSAPPSFVVSPPPSSRGPEVRVAKGLGLEASGKPYTPTHLQANWEN